MQQFAYTTGKNSTDSSADHRRDGPALRRQRRGVRARHQRQRLHQPRDPAAGVGQDRLRPRPAAAPRVSLQNACDQFIFLEVLGTEHEADEPDDRGRTTRRRRGAGRAQPAERADQGGQHHGRRRRLGHASARSATTSRAATRRWTRAPSGTASSARWSAPALPRDPHGRQPPRGRAQGAGAARRAAKKATAKKTAKKAAEAGPLSSRGRVRLHELGQPRQLVGVGASGSRRGRG